MYRIAAIQMASGTNVTANLHETARLINDAVKMGAKLIVLPENFALMGVHRDDTFAIAEPEGTGVLQNFLSQQAAKHQIWLVGGTIPLLSDVPNKVTSVSLVFNDKGQCVGRYDKIHLFDVTVSNEESYNESETYDAGEKICVLDTPFGRLGVAICYDLRFPELFRHMVEQKVELIAIPAAFTASTGRAHWDVLVRARAIENLCYVVAADQGGFHVNGRETYGDSMIVNPWGTVLTRLKRGTGVICSDIEHDRLAEIRQKFPVLKHRKTHLFS